jgi:formylglycine-generating enzyme required for sulfatase activity
MSINNNVDHSHSSKHEARKQAVEAIDWVEIPGGEFLFGLSERQAEQFLDDLPFNLRTGSDPKWLSRLQNEIRRETPQRQVNVESFYISRYPITCQQYLPFAEGDHPFADSSRFTGQDLETVLDGLRSAAEKTGDHPASVSWHSALAFCEWIGARLPTSAEWEKAARGTEGPMYPWGNNWDARNGNFTTDRVRWPHKTSPVTAYPSGQSPFGIMDLMGNANEWTLSTVLLEAEYAVVRGTSCNFDALMDQQYNPTWFRNRVTAFFGNAMNFGGSTDPVGFRPVMDRWQARAWAGF